MATMVGSGAPANSNNVIKVVPPLHVHQEELLTAEHHSSKYSVLSDRLDYSIEEATKQGLGQLYFIRFQP